MANNNKKRPDNFKRKKPHNKNTFARKKGSTDSSISKLSRQELEDKYKKLQDKIEELEKKLSEFASDNGQITTSQSIPVDTKISLPAKFEAIMSKDFIAIGKENDTLKVKIADKDLAESQIILGDTLLIEAEKGSIIKKIKVAQKVKRIDHEALVTEKDGTFYAVSQFATHKLLTHEVQTKGILKGFELTITLPEGKEKDAYFCLVKFVEGGEVPGKPMNSISKPQYDPRVIEDDDLV